MLDRDIQRHAKEFKAYLDGNKYEVSEEGIHFPKAQVGIKGEYLVRSPGYADSIEPNIITTEGLNHILMVALRDTAKLNTFYLALFSGAYTPVAGLTAATFASTATEITSGSEGYSNATRPAWAPAAAASASMDSFASEAAFNIVTATSVTIRGAALLSSNVKGSTTGVLISASRFAQDRTQYNTDVFNLGYRVSLTST